MTKKMYMHITIISFIIGFMLAVQYNTVQNPEKQETIDVWEIRQELSDEQKLHSQLLTEIRQAQDTVRKYEDEELENPEAILVQTVDRLKEAAGLKSVMGPGIVLTISPSLEAIEYGYEINEIPPSLLIRLVNAIYRYKGQYVEVGGQRLIHSSAIRDINGKTTVGSVPLDQTAIDIKVITATEEEANKLYNHLMASTFMDEFFIDNMMLEVGQPQATITIKATDVEIRHSYLTEYKGD